MRGSKSEIIGIYHKLRKRYGFLDWWPGETADEIIIGAVLTQQTSWKNVEKALANLRKEKLLGLGRIAATKQLKLEKLLRPSGFYRRKSGNLRNLAIHIYGNYAGVGQFLKKDAKELRKELLEQNGIGKETADSIILYAAGKKMFVIDAYTKRIMKRVCGMKSEMDYDTLQRMISDAIPGSLRLYKDFHAQFVELGKRHCKSVPLCHGCPLTGMCDYFKTLPRQRESS